MVGSVIRRAEITKRKCDVDLSLNPVRQKAEARTKETIDMQKRQGGGSIMKPQEESGDRVSTRK